MADDTQHSEAGASAPDAPRTPRTPRTPVRQPEPADGEAALRRELAGVRGINEAVEGILATLGRAGGNMEVVTSTVANASTLLSTWTRILSQTEHNQRLVANPAWRGATHDVAAHEEEALERQRAAERKAADEERRREELRRQRDDDEERRRLGAPTPSSSSSSARGARGATRLRSATSRGRASLRGTAAPSHLPDSGRPGAPGSRGASATGRGLGADRGRSRAAR